MVSPNNFEDLWREAEPAWNDAGFRHCNLFSTNYKFEYSARRIVKGLKFLNDSEITRFIQLLKLNKMEILNVSIMFCLLNFHSF